MELVRDGRGPDGFPFEESHVRARLGWNKDEARAMRKKFLKTGPQAAPVSGLDWCVHKKRVFYSEGGVAALCKALGVPLPEKNGAGEPSSIVEAGDAVKEVVSEKIAGTKDGPEKAPGGDTRPTGVVLVRVCRCDWPNRRIVTGMFADVEEARARDWQGTNGDLRVRVRDNGALRRGDVVACRRIAGHVDYFELEGKLPRRRFVNEKIAMVLPGGKE